MMQKFLGVFILTGIILISGLTAFAKNELAATTKLMVVNDSPGLVIYERLFIPSGVTAHFTIKRPDLEGFDLGTLFFGTGINGQLTIAELFMVRAPAVFWSHINNGGELTVSFSAQNGQYRADISANDEPAARAGYLYHPVLNTWGFIEPEFGIVVYQDNKADWHAWQTAQQSGMPYITAWEHLYPGEIDDWLRSPLESRGFVVPLTEIYDVSTWNRDKWEEAHITVTRLTPDWPMVNQTQIIVVKSFGDMGWGMLAYQNGDGQWFFMDYGFDGWGAYGDLRYKIADTPPPYIKSNGDEPWEVLPGLSLGRP